MTRLTGKNMTWAGDVKLPAMSRRTLLSLEDANHLYSKSEDESLVGQVEDSVTNESETYA